MVSDGEASAGRSAGGIAEGGAPPVPTLCLVPALVVMGIFAVALGALFQYSLLEFIPGSLRTGGLSDRNFRQVVAPQYLRAIWETIILSLATTVLTLLASYPVAYAVARGRCPALRSFLLILTLAPFFTGAIVRTYAWILVLGNSGFINNFLLKAGFLDSPYQMLFTARGVLVGLVHFSMPVMILILAAAISHIDPTYERAAESLGANPVGVFVRVTLPLSLPGVISGSMVVFAWTFSAFPTPELLGGGRVKMIANVVKDLALDSFNWPGAAAFAVVALSVTFILVAVVARALEGLRFGRPA